MDPGELMEELFDRKTLAILRLFSRDQERQFYLREISKLTRVPVATVYRIVNKLTRLNILELHQIKRFKLYSYAESKEAKFVEQLIEVRGGAVEEFVELCRPMEEIKQVILHGKKLKDKANLLLIGDSIPTSPLVEAAARIKETYGFTIIYLTLGPQQYEQMVEMGLYAGDRQILLQK